MTRSTAARRTLAALAVTPLLLTGLAACGDNGETTAKDTANDSIAGTAVLTGLQSGDEVEPSEFVGIVVDGLEASTTAHMTMTSSMGDLGELTGEGDIDYTADPASMTMTMTMPPSVPMLGDEPAEVRFVDGVLYMSMGEITGGKFWKIDLSDPSGPLGDLGTLLDVDPASMMERVEPAIEKVTFEGEEDVDGRTLDRYELTVDGAALGKATGIPDAAKAQLPDSLSYDLWLDEEHRLAQMKMELPVQGATADMEMVIDDWGKDVDIEAPPAGQVTDMPDLGSMGGQPKV